MRRTRRIAGNGRATGIGAPIAWSAAGHLFALLAVLSAVPGSPSFSLPGVVEVLLVPGRHGASGPGPVSPSPRRGLEQGETVKGGSAGGGALSPPLLRPVAPERVPEATVAVPNAAPGGPPDAGRLDAAEAVEPAGGRPAEGHAGEERGGPPSHGRGGSEASPPSWEHAAGDPGIPPGGDAPGDAGTSGAAAGPRLALLRFRIQERIVYPAEAVRRGQEGEVLLRIRIGIGGIPREIRVARSSGSRILDEAASSGVVRAAPLPSAPGWFEIPVRFSLR